MKKKGPKHQAWSTLGNYSGLRWDNIKRIVAFDPVYSALKLFQQRGEGLDQIILACIAGSNFKKGTRVLVRVMRAVILGDRQMITTKAMAANIKAAQQFKF